MSTELQPFEEIEERDNWRTNALLVGGVLGTILGLGTAFFFIRTAEESGKDDAPTIEVSDALKISFGLISLIRGIAALGSRD
jgi:hypothetical protein